MIMGATGVGKSYLACALGTAACRNRYSCRYTRTPELLDQLAMAGTDGSVRQIIQQYRKPRLLILDEWLITRISHGGLEDIFEIMECRSTEQRSTIFCSQIETSEWLAALGNSLMAESLMDRIIHCSYKNRASRRLNEEEKRIEVYSSQYSRNEITHLNEWARRRYGGLVCYGTEFHDLRNGGLFGA
ncbi:ATP-binding protein [Cloacibacillus evryensis]|uniref:ATP-binding protein n=1 Tax=Cloacibacillus evryensis TaxID=508460 RepID=UPI0004B8C015|nr:ATP-binding protein [Cloacibacillus evryensis]